jgi:sestrin
LEGLDHVPLKIQALNDINKILAHQPWLIAKTDIEALVKPGPNSWSLSELMHAVVILCHYHCLCGFAHGCALNAEIDTKYGHIMRPLSQELETEVSPSGSRLGSLSTSRASLASESMPSEDVEEKELDEMREMILETLREDRPADDETTAELELQEFATQSKASAECKWLTCKKRKHDNVNK